MEKLDIVKLIEKNPLTRLNKDYQNVLIKKIQERFSDNQQQLFVASFYCYLNYNSKTDFIIDLDNVWKWVGFSRKDPAKRLLEKSFTLNIDYKIVFHPNVEQDLHGGHNKEQILMNIQTFKKFCLKAATKKADEIHDYYIKLEEILQETINDETNELKIQLELKDKQLEEKDENIEKIQKQKVLLKEFASIGSLVYIIKVKTLLNSEYIIKIGESRVGVEARYNEHKSKYEECLLLDCFLVKKSKDFESFIHENIKGNRVTNLKNHENERELFLIGNKLSYLSVLNLINKNIKYYNDYNTNDLEKLQLENENLKLQIELNKNNQHIQIEHMNKVILERIESLEKSLLDKFSLMQTKTTNNFNEVLPTLGPRVQCINPDTMKLVKVYESVSELMKENNQIRRPSINKAIKENTIYHNYRWNYVNRDLDSTIIDIKLTKPTRIQNIGYIAKLNKEKTEIVNVYLDKKVLSKFHNKTHSAFDNPVKNFSEVDGFYYILYDNCSTELKNNFIKKYGEPILYKDGVGQYDDKNKLINEFTCKSYCCKKLSISDRTLNKALETNKLYNGFYYKLIGEKLKFL